MASTTGTASIAISVIRKLRRKSSSTSAARPTPISTASRTPCADEVIRSLWSYQLAIFTSAGRLFCSLRQRRADRRRRSAPCSRPVADKHSTIPRHAHRPSNV